MTGGTFILIPRIQYTTVSRQAQDGRYRGVHNTGACGLYEQALRGGRESETDGCVAQLVE